MILTPDELEAIVKKDFISWSNRTIYPITEVQTCVVHQIRNSLKYVASKDQKEFMTELKPVYKADNESIALDELAKLKDKWNKKYPMVIGSWGKKLAEAVDLF